MKKEDLKVLERLVKDPEIKGKKSLARFIWVNTTPPKYEVGKLVKVTDYSRTICGSKVVDWIGTVEEISTVCNECKYTYGVRVKYVGPNGKISDSLIFAHDDKIKSTRAKKDLNYPVNTDDTEYISL